MGDVLTYKDLLKAKEVMELNEVPIDIISDGFTMIPNGILLEACNHEEWQEKRIKELEDQLGY